MNSLLEERFHVVLNERRQGCVLEVLSEKVLIMLQDFVPVVAINFSGHIFSPSSNDNETNLLWMLVEHNQ